LRLCFSIDALITAIPNMQHLRPGIMAQPKRVIRPNPRHVFLQTYSRVSLDGCRRESTSQQCGQTIAVHVKLETFPLHLYLLQLLFANNGNIQYGGKCKNYAILVGTICSLLCDCKVTSPRVERILLHTSTIFEQIKGQLAQ